MKSPIPSSDYVASSKKHKKGIDFPAAHLSIFLKLLFVFTFFGIFPLLISTLALTVGYESLIFDTVGDLGLAISSEEQDIIEKSLNTLRFQTVLIFVFFATLIFLGSFTLGKLFVNPIKRLSIAIQKLGSGKIPVTVPVKSNDEFGKLTRQFNEMVISLREIQEREEVVNRLKNEFIGILAHQLRTPTSAVKWALSILRENSSALTRNQKDLINRGYLANERMIRLIIDLLDVTRIEEGKFGYAFRYIDFIALLNQVISETRLIANKRDITIEALVKEKRPKIYGDSDKITLALSNILTNSVNYTNPGGKITIECNCDEARRFLHVTIKDTGVGIPSEDIKHLFTKFFRGSNVIQMQTEGSGLGLFIARNVIEQHGGKITIESQEGKGTAVSITFPLSIKDIPREERAFERFIKSTDA